MAVMTRAGGVKIELQNLLATGRIDLAMAGVPITPERAAGMLFSDPYLDETFALWSKTTWARSSLAGRIFTNSSTFAWRFLICRTSSTA